MINQDKIRQAVRLLLEGIGEDISREGLIDTPDRIARMYTEIFSGMEEDAGEHLSRAFHADNSDRLPKLCNVVTGYRTAPHRDREEASR